MNGMGCSDVPAIIVTAGVFGRECLGHAAVSTSRACLDESADD
jgi:hypothetical protein